MKFTKVEDMIKDYKYKQSEKKIILITLAVLSIVSYLTHPEIWIVMF